MTTGLIVDLLIICLLTASTGYCVVLNRRLAILRQGQKEFLTLIGRFDDATQRAEVNISRLRSLSGEVDENLGAKISAASALRDELRFLIERAVPAAEHLMTEPARRDHAPKIPFTTSPHEDISGSVVEADLLEALRAARKG